MRTKDLFKVDRSARRINESMEKLFGKKIKLESFSLEQLQDARNKLRTQLSQQRAASGFNENIENEAYSKAQWMLDAINAEIAQREEFISETEVQEGFFDDMMEIVDRIRDEHGPDLDKDQFEELFLAMLEDEVGPEAAQRAIEDEIDFVWSEYIDPESGWDDTDDADDHREDFDQIDELSKETLRSYWKKAGVDASKLYTKAHHISNQNQEKKSDKLSALEKQAMDKSNKRVRGHNRALSKLNTKENQQRNTTMKKIYEGEIDQASAIVTANTMVDRLGRWIEELSGMENETLLQLGDSIRDEMGQEQSRQFIEAVAPTIQSALETLKSARESVSGAVRALATGQSPEPMLGAPEEPGMGDEMDMTEPDAMNAGDIDIGPEEPVDDFDAAEPAAGGMETAGREKRESIEFQNRLLKVLAG